jgi:hypothetical protein
VDDITRFKEALLAVFMAQYEEQYAHSRNPVHLWQMYRFARQNSLAYSRKCPDVPGLRCRSIDHTSWAALSGVYRSRAGLGDEGRSF